LKGSLESIASKEGVWDKMFRRKRDTTREQNKYLSTKEAAENLLEEVAGQQELYAKEMPEVVKSAGEVQRGKLAGGLADRLYAIGVLDKKVYHGVKSKIYSSAMNFINATNQSVQKYLATPATSYMTAILGLCFVLFGYENSSVTASVVGSFSNVSSLFLGGISLLVISMAMFFVSKK